MKTIVLMLAAALLVGCPPSPKPVPIDAADSGQLEPPIAVIDASLVVEDEDAGLRSPACRRACDQLRKIGCPEANTTDGGLSCYAVCANAETTGKFNLRPECLADAGTQDDARKCGSVRCGKR